MPPLHTSKWCWSFTLLRYFTPLTVTSGCSQSCWEPLVSLVVVSAGHVEVGCSELPISEGTAAHESEVRRLWTDAHRCNRRRTLVALTVSLGHSLPSCYCSLWKQTSQKIVPLWNLTLPRHNEHSLPLKLWNCLKLNNKYFDIWHNQKSTLPLKLDITKK